MTKLIEANTTIPTSKTEVFSTAADNQSSVEIHVLQGERVKAQDNRTLGRFHLDGIPPAPRGIPQIQVTFDIDANGVLSVNAKDKGTGKEQSIRIEASSGLSDEEIEKMKNAAEEHAEEDKRIREKVEILNKADSLIFSSRKQLGEYGEKLSEQNKSNIQQALDKLEKLHKEEKVDELEAAMEELNKAWSDASAELYQATQQAQQESQTSDAGQTGDQSQSAGDSGSDKEDSDTVDAEFEVVDEDEEKDKKK